MTTRRKASPGDSLGGSNDGGPISPRPIHDASEMESVSKRRRSRRFQPLERNPTDAGNGAEATMHDSGIAMLMNDEPIEQIEHANANASADMKEKSPILFASPSPGPTPELRNTAASSSLGVSRHSREKIRKVETNCNSWEDLTGVDRDTNESSSAEATSSLSIHASPLSPAPGPGSDAASAFDVASPGSPLASAHGSNYGPVSITATLADATHAPWTVAETKQLVKLVQHFGEVDEWVRIAEQFEDRSAYQCAARWLQTLADRKMQSRNRGKNANAKSDMPLAVASAPVLNGGASTRPSGWDATVIIAPNTTLTFTPILATSVASIAAMVQRDPNNLNLSGAIAPQTRAIASRKGNGRSSGTGDGKVRGSRRRRAEDHIKTGRWTATEDRALANGVNEYLAERGLQPEPPSHLPTEDELRTMKMIEYEAKVRAMVALLSTRTASDVAFPRSLTQENSQPHSQHQPQHQTHQHSQQQPYPQHHPQQQQQQQQQRSLHQPHPGFPFERDQEFEGLLSGMKFEHDLFDAVVNPSCVGNDDNDDDGQDYLLQEEPLALGGSPSTAASTTPLANTNTETTPGALMRTLTVGSRVFRGTRGSNYASFDEDFESEYFSSAGLFNSPRRPSSPVSFDSVTVLEDAVTPDAIQQYHRHQQRQRQHEQPSQEDGGSNNRGLSPHGLSNRLEVLTLAPVSGPAFERFQQRDEPEDWEDPIYSYDGSDDDDASLAMAGHGYGEGEDPVQGLAHGYRSRNVGNYWMTTASPARPLRSLPPPTAPESSSPGSSSHSVHLLPQRFDPQQPGSHSRAQNLQAMNQPSNPQPDFREVVDSNGHIDQFSASVARYHQPQHPQQPFPDGQQRGVDHQFGSNMLQGIVNLVDHRMDECFRNTDLEVTAYMTREESSQHWHGQLRQFGQSAQGWQQDRGDQQQRPLMDSLHGPTTKHVHSYRPEHHSTNNHLSHSQSTMIYPPRPVPAPYIPLLASPTVSSSASSISSASSLSSSSSRQGASFLFDSQFQQSAGCSDGKIGNLIGGCGSETTGLWGGMTQSPGISTDGRDGFYDNNESPIFNNSFIINSVPTTTTPLSSPASVSLPIIPLSYPDQFRIFKLLPETRDAYCLAISRAISLCPWSTITAKSIPGRTGVQAQARWSEALDPQVRKGAWTAAEDAMLMRGVNRNRRCWIWIADDIPGRTQRQCRTRWVQILTRRQRAAAEAAARAVERIYENAMQTEQEAEGEAEMEGQEQQEEEGEKDELNEQELLVDQMEMEDKEDE